MGKIRLRDYIGRYGRAKGKIPKSGRGDAGQVWGTSPTCGDRQAGAVDGGRWEGAPVCPTE